MNWFEKIIPPKIKTGRLGKSGVPEGLWNKCSACQAVLYAVELQHSLHVCPKCGHHMRITAETRLRTFLDADSLERFGEEVLPLDMLKFRDRKRYRDRLSEARKSSAVSEALLAAHGKLKGAPLTALAFEFRFMGGSMGSVVGERFVRAADHSLAQRQPLVCFSASGGARMQEALFSLLQMSKTTAAITRLRASAIPFVSVLTDPTMGGVSASLAMLGDIIIGEPGALIGFAGPRVIEQTVRETLPEGFQRAEFQLEHGALDMIVDRRSMRDTIGELLAALGFGAGGANAPAAEPRAP
ncbi:MAG: acetyl-CoA carboxylase, carboxyltransferase subunit beta [Gammaproteobacteria bacterium]